MLAACVAPLTGTSFRFQQKPPKPLFDKEICTIFTVIGLTGLATCYRAFNMPKKKLRDKNSGYISYKTQKPSIALYITGFSSAVLSLIAIKNYFENYLPAYFNFYEWTQRTNQEVYYDARETYKNTARYATVFHDAAEQPEHVRPIMALACVDINKDITPILNKLYIPLKDHYEALIERLASNTDVLYKWDKLKQKIEHELGRLATTIAFFSETPHIQQAARD